MTAPHPQWGYSELVRAELSNGATVLIPRYVADALATIGQVTRVLANADRRK